MRVLISVREATACEAAAGFEALLCMEPILSVGSGKLFDYRTGKQCSQARSVSEDLPWPVFLTLARLDNKHSSTLMQN